MSFKPNPGCALPELKLPPDLSSFVSNLVTQAVGRALPEAARAQARALAAQKQATDAATAAVARADKYKKLAESFVNISCPLPNVPDPDASK